jgi:predicted nucleic acid-binding protein
VDTGAWFATFVPNDPDHAAADAWLEANVEPLVTTDYVVDELLTLLKIRGEFQRAMRLGASLFADEIAHIEWVMPDDVRQAWAVFQRYTDKDWSFTDCVSRVVMERLGIRTAFAFDDGFRQFGTVTVVP